MSAPERPADEPVRAPHSTLPSYYATPEARRGFISRAFDAAAADYDRVDRLLAFGSGAWYRRQALLRAGLAADPADPEGFTRFYMTVWKAFFLAYVLVPLAFVV